MHARLNRRLRGRVLCLAAVLALLPTAACTSETPDRPAKERPKSPQPSPSAPSIFDGSVRVGVKKGQPGFNIKSDYEYAGFETELLNHLSDYTPFKKYHPGDIPSLKREDILRDGSTDMVVATYSITDIRDDKVDFTAPYMKTDQGLLVRKDYDGIKELGDLKDKRVCTAEGSTSAPDDVESEAARKALRIALGADVKLLFRKDYKQCVKELIKGGNFEAVWTDKLVLEGFAHERPYSQDIEVVPEVTIERRQFYGVGLREGRAPDCRKLNRALQKFLKDDWVQVFRQYFPKLAKGDFIQTYRPTPEEFERYRERSCGAKDK